MKHSKTEYEFIAARESRWFITVFDGYVRNLFWRRFHQVWVKQQYYPSNFSKSIYYLNHTSWWDGLVPFLLNQKLFRQNARAMMEDRQMKQHTFFKKIGAFSVNLESSRNTLTSLRYAVESMERPHSSLFIYPEGKIVPFSTKKPDFKKGLAWIASKCPDADFVPVGIYIHTAASDKPELFLQIGNAVDIQAEKNHDVLNEILEIELQNLILELVDGSFTNKENFKKLI